MYKIRDIKDHLHFREVIDELSRGDLGIASRTPSGYTLLHLAAEVNTSWVLYELVKLGADVNARTEDGETPAIVATRMGHLRNLEVLYALGADLEIYDNLEDSALLWASYQGSIHIVTFLVEEAGVDVDHLYKNGQPAISWAAKCGHVDVVDYLFFKTSVINSGEVDLCANKSRQTRALIHANRRALTRELAHVFTAHADNALLEPALFGMVHSYLFKCSHL